MTALGPDWELQVDSVTPESWTEMLDMFTDANIYQTWAYGAVRWGAKNLSHAVLKRRGEVAAIAQLRTIRPLGLNVGMAYLRWGPVWERRGWPTDCEALEQMSRALRAEYVQRRGLLLQVLPNAFAGTQRAKAMESAFTPYERKRLAAEEYRTFVLDLGPTLEDLRKKLDKKWRNKLTLAEKHGLVLVAGTGPDEYRVFRDMYYEMRKRKNFAASVDVEEFGRIQRELPEPHRMQVMICEHDGIPVAGAVCSAMGNSAVYLLGATANEGLNLSGAYFLQWTLIRWLKERGIKWYDLGGADARVNPGVYSFKKGMSGADVTQPTPYVACGPWLSSGAVHVSLVAQRSMRWLAGAFESRQVTRG